MNEHVWASMNVAYPQLINIVNTHGQKYTPRGLECREMRPFAFSIIQPEHSLYTGTSRNLNLRFWAVETLSYLAGFGDEPWHADLLCMTNKGMRAYINPETGTFDGAYGVRMRESLLGIIDLLRRDPDTRQAVMSIWKPGVPNDSLDIPCTVMLHFFRDADSLSCVSYMRSNDLNWGTPYDVPAFCAILGFVAHFVGLEPGEYTHIAGSLHAYKDVTGGPKTPKVDAEDTFTEIRVPMDWGSRTPEQAVSDIRNFLMPLYECARLGVWEPSFFDGYLAPWAMLIARHRVCP